MNMIPCPFCGGVKLKIDSKQKFEGCGYRVTCSVRCNSCHARGGTVSGIVPMKMTEPRADVQYTTAKALEEQAILKWNRRSGKT